MKRKWYFLINPFFLKSQRRNYKRLDKLSGKHLVALVNAQDNAEIKILYLRTKPLVEEYHSELVQKSTVKGEKSTLVLSFSELLNLLPDKMATWDIKIQNIFLSSTPEWKNIYIMKRSDIYKCSAEQILINIKSFLTRVKKYPDLTAIADEINSFVEQLQNTYDSKDDMYDGLDTTSVSLNKKYDAVCDILYRNLGSLINIFGESPDDIEHYYDLSLIQKNTKKKTTTDESADGGSLLQIPAAGTATADFELMAGKTYLIEVIGGALQVYGGSTANEEPKQAPIELAADSETEITSAQLGYPANKLMIFKNKGLTSASKAEIFLLDEE